MQTFLFLHGLPATPVIDPEALNVSTGVSQSHESIEGCMILHKNAVREQG
jgi:hypothetical protein